MKILVLNGANLNMLGKRDVSLYGSCTLDEIQKQIVLYGKERGAKVICRHSNSEGKLIDILQKSKVDGAIINAGAYSHYSYALRDCIDCLPYPVVEVHITDIYVREDFRHVDVLKDVCKAQIVGKGTKGYLLALDELVAK